MGGRPRKPTAVLELAGAFIKHKDRKADRADEPKPLGKIGKAPKSLDEDSTKVWDDMAREGHWLTSADRFLLEIAAKYMAYFSRGGGDTKVIGQLITVLNKLGFGPAERSKIKAPGAKDKDDEDPFAEFKK